ncbi:MAG: biotin/lipoyl-binding protein, partial [Verrucomicrobiaceae bacterium]
MLATLAVKDGQEVKQGELLATLDDELEALEVARRALVMEAAKKDYERTKQVFDNGKSVSRDELDQKEANFKVAEVEHRIAQAQLRRRQLRAPYDGIISDHFDLDPGESVQPNAPVVRLVNPYLCRFTCHVRGTADHGLKVGRAVVI